MSECKLVLYWRRHECYLTGWVISNCTLLFIKSDVALKTTGHDHYDTDLDLFYKRKKAYSQSPMERNGL